MKSNCMQPLCYQSFSNFVTSRLPFNKHNRLRERDGQFLQPEMPLLRAKPIADQSSHSQEPSPLLRCVQWLKILVQSQQDLCMSKIAVTFSTPKSQDLKIKRTDLYRQFFKSRKPN
ncbi:hypothetical protein ACFX1R_033097 [Malus domestica]